MSAQVIVDAKILPQGQITIPRDIRRAMSVAPGDRVLLVLDQDKVTMMNPTSMAAKDLDGPDQARPTSAEPPTTTATPPTPTPAPASDSTPVRERRGWRPKIRKTTRRLVTTLAQNRPPRPNPFS